MLAHGRMCSSCAGTQSAADARICIRYPPTEDRMLRIDTYWASLVRNEMGGTHRARSTWLNAAARVSAGQISWFSTHHVGMYGLPTKEQVGGCKRGVFILGAYYRLCADESVSVRWCVIRL
jgi:hypothetical protein